MLKKLKHELRGFALLLQSVPPLLLAVFTMSVMAMNLLANKSIALPVSWMALDCGILVSWISFLVMDMVTKHFGPKAATELSLVAVGVHLLACLFFFAAGKIPGVWGAAAAGNAETVNGALNRTFGGTWYVLLGSTVAFLVSATVNNALNYAIGRLFSKRPAGFAAYACRSYVSTAIGQFCDNLVFALIVSHVFFGWSLLQCVVCALTGMAAELLCEILFSRFGYAVCKKWQREQVGSRYFAYIKGESSCGS